MGLSGIGMVGGGQVFQHGKDDPMQLSDIIPKKSMYDKMRPPKVEGKLSTLNLLLLIINVALTELDDKVQILSVIRSNPVTILKIQFIHSKQSVLEF